MKKMFLLLITVSLIATAQGQNAFKGVNTSKLKIDYETNLRSTFTQYSLIDLGYLDSVLATMGVTTIYTGNGSLTSDRTATGGAYSTTFTTSAELPAITGSATANGVGIWGTSVGYLAGLFSGYYANTDFIETTLQLNRFSTGTAASGIGGAIDFHLDTDASTERAARFIYKWNNATQASRTSHIDFTGVDNATEETFMNIQPSLVRINNNADTLATKAYARSVVDAPRPIGITLESPSASESIIFGGWQTDVDITVTSVKAVLTGSSPSVTFNIAFGSDITSLTNVFTSGQTVTSTTTGTTFNSGFNDATIPAGSWVVFTTSASTNTNSISISIAHTND